MNDIAINEINPNHMRVIFTMSTIFTLDYFFLILWSLFFILAHISLVLLRFFN